MADLRRTQAAYEQDAIRLTQRPEVREAVRSQAQRWRAGTPGFRPETYARLGTSLDEVVLLVALQVVNDDPTRPDLVEISAGPHRGDGFDVPGGRWGINNPDTLYFAAPIEPGASYVVTGRPRAEMPIDVNVSVQLPDVWHVLDSIGSRDLRFEADGSFRVAVGSAADGVANRLPIGDGGTTLLVRQTLADWGRELPFDLSIERTDGAALRAPASDDERAERLIRRLDAVIGHSLRTLQPPIFSLPANTIPQPDPAGTKSGYLTAQRNTLGHFRIDDGEALVVTLSPGGAGYAAVATPDVWGVTTDSARHTNSLNSRQAVLDADGRVTVVVANSDPGVVNWVDPGGLREGIVMLRWQLLDHDPSVVDEPAVRSRLVELTQVGDVLPDASRIGLDERRRWLADRAEGYARRFVPH